MFNYDSKKSHPQNNLCRAHLGDGQEEFCLRKIKSRKLATPTAAVTFVTAALLLLAVLGGTQAIANTMTWGNVGTDFATGTNWLGGTAPADNTTSDIGAFANATVTDNPVFTADRSINGLQFNTGTAAWTFTGSGGTQTLTLGSGGITNNSANTQTFSASGLQLALGTDLTFAATSGALAIDSAVNLTNFNLTLGGASAGSAISGVVSGTGALSKTGTGTWTLSGPNTYTGGTTINAGTVAISNGSSFGSNTVTFESNGTTVAALASVQVTNNYALTGSGTMDVGASVLTNSGVISGGGALTKAGAGTMVLTASNTYTGVTTVSNGTLNIQNNTALGPANGGTNGRTVVASGASLDLQNNITVTGESLSIAGTGVGTNGALRNVSGTNIWTGPINLTDATKFQSEAGELVISGSIDNGVPSYTQRSTGNGLTVDGPANTTISGPVKLDGANITKTGAGTLTISGNNTSAGNLNLNGGVLQVAANTSLGTNEIDFDGGTLRTTATMALTPNTRPIDIGSNGGTIDVVTNTTLTYEGSMTGTGKLTKIGTGTFSVGQLTNYSVAVGTTGVPTNKFGSPSYYNFDQLTPDSGGTQVVTNSFGPTNSMTVTFDGTAVVRTNIHLSPAPNGGNGAGFGTNGTTQPNGPNETPWLYSPETNFITMNLSQPSRYFGILWGVLDPNVDILSFRDATNGVLFEVDGKNFGGTNWGTYYVNVNSDIPFSSVVATIPDIGSGQQFEFDNVATSTNGGTRSGPVDILEGEFQVINNGVFNTVGSTEAVFVATNATLNFNGSTNLTQQNIGTLSGAGTVINSGSNALSLRINATSNSTFSGLITDTTNNLSLVKLGSATLTLSGGSANTYSGTTTVSGGTLNLNKTAGVDAIAGPVAVNSGAILLLSSGENVNDSAAVTLSGGTITRGSGVSETFGALTLTGNSFLNFGGVREAANLAFGTLSLGGYNVSVSGFRHDNQLKYAAASEASGLSLLSSFSFDHPYTTSFSTGTFTITAIPEPSTYVAAIGLLALLLWPLRRRRSACRAARAGVFSCGISWVVDFVEFEGGEGGDHAQVCAAEFAGDGVDITGNRS
jgi:fibronectin-binding autotransporter adhesin